MELIGSILNLLLLQPIINFIILILRLLQSLHIPGALGFSIIILTIVVSLLTWRFRSAQIRHTKDTAEKMALVKPKIAVLKQKHKDDKLAFTKAQQELYKEHGINPAAGCLPSLIPLVIIFPLYQVIFSFFSGPSGLEKINYFLYSKSWHLDSLPDPNFFGLNLGSKPSEFGQIGFLVLLIPLLTAALTFVQSKMMSPATVKVYPSDSKKEVKEKESTEESLAAMQGQMVFMMPLMVGFFAFQFPIGLALYWNTLTSLGILQQYLITGWGGMQTLIDKVAGRSNRRLHKR